MTDKRTPGQIDGEYYQHVSDYAAGTTDEHPNGDVPDGYEAMTGAEHYRQAERLIQDAEALGDTELERNYLLAANAHAALAVAAATALTVVDRYKGDSALTNEWSDAIGWAP